MIKISMLGDIVRALFHKPVTEQYPFQRTTPPEHLRGKLIYNAEKCTGCALCNKDCPANAIELITIDKKAKRFVMRYHADRCTYCAQCVSNCRFACIEMSNDQWELAALQRQPFEVMYGRDEDVQKILASFAHDKEPEVKEPEKA